MDETPYQTGYKDGLAFYNPNPDQFSSNLDKVAYMHGFHISAGTYDQ